MERREHVRNWINNSVEIPEKGSEGSEQRDERGGGIIPQIAVQGEEELTGAVTISCRYSCRL